MKCRKFLALLMTGALLSAPALALDDDYRQPIKVTSDNSSADIQSYTLIYSGNVRIVQGSMEIKADELKVISSAEKGNEVMIATGKPATYTQMMENGLPAEAQAKEIRYEVRTRQLTLSGDAQLSQAGSLMRGNTISYNVEKQQLIAEGKEDEQITTIFLPADLGTENQSETEPKPEPEAEPKP
ncbi:lipopolysaccharide transport periplasmic protein LptA [Ferrimonas balearica]|uniref:lipopolysaccharide transport periplasmic protein LptA n=1 Tax=Ferrimonas balearica TaxID=44012 RepID=UPI001C59B7E1|nr:lipopolysaccharide transport periplasmic protein LptA [Ferrimonas balearica]MBW3165801.1 lipopolysaccharide transport periplasmic protein LptA [Ferrimonas balearica]MBY6107977.1 lipopolysaccharide transport periplasmic protein LptA [Ferrimonas balearica]MBY6225317.1 lipopolysaccharide transport periplasmic protein LptA [Ferrimonas balearica]